MSSARDAAISRIARVKEMQDHFLGEGRIAKALGFRVGDESVIECETFIPPPSRWDRGNRIWSFG